MNSLIIKMGRIIFSLLFVILLISFASANIIITQQPEEIYNLGDTINSQVEIYADAGPITGKTLTTNLLCNGFSILSVNKQGIIDLNTGESIQIYVIIHIDKELLNERTAATGCVLKSFLGSESPVLTNEFKISDLIKIDWNFNKSEVAPEEKVVIEGQATKENNEPAQGFAKLKITGANTSTIEMTDTVKNGYFYLNFSFPKETKAGLQIISLEVYEEDINGKITNKGSVNSDIRVAQVPTNLEVVFENSEVEPGTNLKVKTILHDQTGEFIEATSIITIKNSKNEILEQQEIQTGNFLEYPIYDYEPPATWKIFAVSSKLTGEGTFNITKKESVGFVMINKTITIVNTGNVEYCNKTVLIKIGNETLNIYVCLDVGESQEYLLTAPEGEYEVKIISEGKEEISKNVMLTGKAVDVKETSKNKFFRQLFIWIFLVAVLGFVAFVLFKKGYKKSLFGYAGKKKEMTKEVNSPLKKGSLVDSGSMAEVSLSIKGDKQDVNIVCIKIKNLRQMESHKGNVKETLQRIVNFAEDRKAATYENQENIFLILAPVKTKTFGNERTAMIIAQKAKEILTEHNKLFKQKIDFGISISEGTIVAKQEPNVLKFMSMGTLMGSAKKLSSLSENEVLISEKIRGKLGAEARVDKLSHGNVNAYVLKEIKDREGHKTFLSEFVKRLERDKQKEDEKK